MSPLRSGLAHATDEFTRTLENKWEKEQAHTRQQAQAKQRLASASKSQAVTEVQPQDSENSYGDEALHPVIAHKHGKCYLCKSYIDRGEAIVSADGEAWVHSECAVLDGWVIA